MLKVQRRDGRVAGADVGIGLRARERRAADQRSKLDLELREARCRAARGGEGEEQQLTHVRTSSYSGRRTPANRAAACGHFRRARHRRGAASRK